MSLFDQVNALAGRRLTFILVNRERIIGELVEATPDGFVVDAWAYGSFFGDQDRQRLYLLASAVAHVSEWRSPQWTMKTRGSS